MTAEQIEQNNQEEPPEEDPYGLRFHAAPLALAFFITLALYIIGLMLT